MSLLLSWILSATNEILFPLLKISMPTKKQAIRHWDVLLVKIDKLPTWLNKSSSNIFLAWKNNNHMIDKGSIYITKDPNTLRESEFLYGYLVAKDTTLIHNEHSPISDENRNALIPNGVYELFKQKEATPDGFKVVLD